MKNKILALLAVIALTSGCTVYRVPYIRQTAVATNSFTSSKSGRAIKVVHTTEKDRFEEETEKPSDEKSTPTKAGPNASLEATLEVAEADNDEFEGKDRAAAKTSIADAPMENFQNLKALIKTLPKDTVMLSHQPPISKAKTSNRVAEEKRNVTVTAYLFAAKKEDDGDYHVILGHAAKSSINKFLNVEVSGVPHSGAFRQPLISVRHDFESFFPQHDKHLATTSGYSHYDPPIQVKLSGSLFYDIDHKPGEVGPEKIRPKTSWEIHPVTHIEFEP